MYSTALLFFEQLNCSVLDLQAQASHLSSETSSIALEIFHNLDADNFDAMQLITAELSIRNPTELYRRFEHEQLWYVKGMDFTPRSLTRLSFQVQKPRPGGHQRGIPR